MNGWVSSRDREYRSGACRRESQPRRLVPGAVGLVGRAEDPPSAAQTKKAAGVESGGGERAVWLESGFDRVGTLPVLAFGRGDLQSHLLADSARQEPADAMRL